MTVNLLVIAEFPFTFNDNIFFYYEIKSVSPFNIMYLSEKQLSSPVLYWTLTS